MILEFSKQAVATVLFRALVTVAIGMFALAPLLAQRRFVVPAGSTLIVTINQALSSRISQSGQIFSATLARPVIVQGRTVIPKGSPVAGTVVTAREQGRVRGEGELALTLRNVTVSGWSYPIDTRTLSLEVQGKGRRTAKTTGIGALGGAVLGGLVGGGKGAAIGGAAGGAAGMAGGAMTGNKQVEIQAESQLAFTLSSSLSIRAR